MTMPWKAVAATAVCVSVGSYLLVSEPTPPRVAEPVAPVTQATPAAQVVADKVVAPARIRQMVMENVSDLAADDPFFNTLPASLADSPRPAALEIDENGSLVIDHRLKNLMEFYLTAMGEEPLESIVARIKQDISQQLVGDAQAQAIEILQGYLQYRNHLGEINNEFAGQYDAQNYDLNTVREMKRRQREARSNFLPADVIESFYQREDEYDQFMLARVALRADGDLSAADKAAQLTLLEQNAPQWILDADTRANKVSEVRAREAALRATDADEMALYSLRAQAYGTEGADQLQALDQRRAQWRGRVTDYRAELGSLISTYGGAEWVDGEALHRLRARYFQGPELVRIRALDKIDLSL